MKRIIMSALSALPLLLSGCNMGPMEEGELPVAEELAAVEQQVIQLSGSGVLYNDSHGRITYTVTNTGDNTKAQLVLRTVNSITWWKSLDVFPLYNGGLGARTSRIETKDSVHEVTTEYRVNPQMPSEFRLEFWKAGAFNIGVFVTHADLSLDHTKGKRITFTWERD
ncbi:hypothetical protein [Archangium violaceum]|uniref:hypothetical protein n=1 Tax=Archangium violaceum TaxID=83451 RepID=UPI0036D89F35